MQNIAITLNDVLRAYIPTISLAYEKHIEQRNNTQSQYEIVNGNPILIKSISKRFIENPKQDPFRITRLFKFYSKEEYIDFLLDNSFTTLATPPLTYDKVCEDFNILYSTLVKKGNKITLISQERGKTKSSTMYFIATNNLLPNRVQFLGDYSKMWSMFDTIITANPYILKRCNLNNDKKTSIKIITDQNKDIPSSVAINQLSEIFDYIYE